MIDSPLIAPIVFQLGPVPVTLPVVTTWGVMAVLTAACALATRRLVVERPGTAQTVLELTVATIEAQIGETMQGDGRPFLPLLGTLFLFLTFANLSGIVPGVHPPSAYIETAAALALIVFVSVQYYGVRRRGAGAYLGSFAKPTIVMLP